MNRTHLLYAFLFSLHGLLLSGQCITGPYSYRAGEELTYEVAYNWGVVWVDAGEVIFRTDKIVRDGVEMFYFDSQGRSYKFYDWMFKVKDRFQSLVKVDGFLPVWFHRETSEGDYDVDNIYSYDWQAGTVVASTENTNKPRTIDTLAIAPCTFDVLSAVYYARTFDFEHYAIGEKIPLRFLIDGEFYDLYLRYLGKELKASRGGSEYPCYKFSAMLVEGTIFAGGEELVAWVTADANKVPVMVEARILIGTIKAYLTGYNNLLTDPGEPVK